MDESSQASAQVENCDLDKVIITGELDRRPSRPPDFQAENQALSVLAKAIANDPETVLERLAQAAMELTGSASAGVSLLEDDGSDGTFRCAATAGDWAPYRNGTMPRAESPCGEVIDRKKLLLVSQPHRAFPALLQADPPIHEALLAPLHLDGEPAGTVWVIKHSADKQFEKEDARLLISLAHFASVAHRLLLGLQEQRDSEAKYRILFETMGQGYVLAETVRDEQGRPIDMRLLRVNPAYERLMGVSADQARGGAYEILPGVDRWWLETCDRIARSGQPERVEHRYNEQGGWFEAWVYPRGGDQYVVLFEDITERKRAEKALEESEARQAFLLRLSDALRPLSQASDIQMTASRLLGDCLNVSRAMYAEISRDGETGGAFIRGQHVREGQRFPDEIPSAMFDDTFVGGSMWTDDRVVMEDIASDPRIREEVRRAWLADGIAAAVAVALVKGGRLLAIFGVHHARPRQWSAGEIAIIEEVAERTWAAAERARAETALRESEERFAQFAASTTDVLWIRDADTMALEYISPAFESVFGVTTGTVTGGIEPGAALVDPADRERVMEHLDAARRGEPQIYEFRVVHGTNGSRRWIRDHCFPLIEENGRVQRIGGIARDVTELKLADEALRESNQDARLLLAELQHRVRNTLAMVRSIAQRTAENSHSAEEMLAHFQGRLDAFSRVQAALTRSADAKVDLCALVEDELLAHATREGERLRIEGPDIALEPKSAERVSLAIHELTTNAVKYGALRPGAEGRVAVTWACEPDGEGEQLVLSWEESGLNLEGEEPGREGFGTELLRRSLPYDLQGETNVNWRPQGLRFILRMPLKRQ